MRAASAWDALRDDPRFADMLKLLDAEVTHTPRYLRDHNLPSEVKILKLRVANPIV
jgi:hypothetical protein